MLFQNRHSLPGRLFVFAFGSVALVACGGIAVHDGGSDADGSGGGAVHDGNTDAGGSGGIAAGGSDVGGSGGNAVGNCPLESFEKGGECTPRSACAAGEYVVADGSATSDRECAPCEAGSFSSSINASECTTWTQCEPGQYVIAGDATTDQSCVACASGTYSAVMNAPSCAAWSACTAGYGETTAGTASSDRACGPEWIRQFGTAQSDWPGSVSVAAGGDVYVAGITQGALAAANAAGNDAFVRKYDSAGTEQWTRQFGLTLNDSAHSVSVDADGNAYVAGGTYGILAGQMSFGDSDAFVRKYDSAGTELWTRQFGSYGKDLAYSVSVDASGYVYVAGQMQGGGLDPNADFANAFVRKYDSAGKEQWTRQLVSTGRDVAYSVSVDASGNVYIAGYTDGALSVPKFGYIDAFVCKFDGAGTEQWRRQFGTAGNDEIHSVSADADGNVFVVGYTDGTLSGTSAGVQDAFVRKYDGAGGVQWTRQFGTASSESAHAVAVDASGSAYVVGGTGGVLSGVKTGLADGYVRKYDATGVEQWTRQFGVGTTTARAVSVDASGRAHVAGITDGALSGMNAGKYDVFVVKLAP